VRRRLGGIAFLVVLAMLVSLTVLLYQKAFTPVVKVTLETNRIGNQLSAPADVKLRGLVVGEVRKISTKGSGASIVLALDPSRVDLIPANVTAQLLPKTLFGEKYVELVTPPKPSTEPIKAGDVIGQDRSSTALETEAVLDNLMPLLQSLRPAELSLALNALSSALRDRGDAFGGNLARAAAYLRQFNPSLPTLTDDFGRLAAFTDTLADVTPQLLTTLDNFAFSSRALVDQKAQLDSFLTRSTRFADTARAVVAQNEKNLISLASASRPVLALYARYSPEYPCLLAGLADYSPIVEKTFGGLQPGLHITLEVTQDSGGYAVGQEPKYRDARAPYCDGLPTPKVPAGETSFDDGYRTSTSPTSKRAGLLERQAALALVAAPVMGVRADQVPDLVGLLLGPLAEGNTVGVRAEGGS
jgi:virulence factor Mce-like protein